MNNISEWEGYPVVWIIKSFINKGCCSSLRSEYLINGTRFPAKQDYSLNPQSHYPRGKSRSILRFIHKSTSLPP